MNKYIGNMFKISLTDQQKVYSGQVNLHVESVDGIAIEWLEKKLQSENITLNIKVVIMSLIEKWKEENDV